jgi:hypothetical protein
MRTKYVGLDYLLLLLGVVEHIDAGLEVVVAHCGHFSEPPVFVLDQLL